MAGAFKDLVNPANIFLLLLVVVVLLTGLFGGWGNLSESKKQLPLAKVETPIEVSPFRVTVRKALWFTDVPIIYRLSPGQRALVLSVDVTNQSDQFISAQTLQAAIKLKGLHLVDPISDKAVASETVEPLVLRGSDGFREKSLQPGLPVSYALLWVQDAAQPVPANLDVVFSKQNYRMSSLDGAMGYFDLEPVSHLVLPTKELKMPK